MPVITGVLKLAAGPLTRSVPSVASVLVFHDTLVPGGVAGESAAKLPDHAPAPKSRKLSPPLKVGNPPPRSSVPP